MNTNDKWIQKSWVVGLLACFCCMLWGSAFPCIKTGYRLFQIASESTGSQILFGGLRFTLAGILTILIGSLLQRKKLVPKKTSWGMIGILSLLQTSVHYILFYIGLAHTTGVKSSIVDGSSTFIAILTACLIFRYEKMTSRKLIGCLIGFAGVVVINLDPSGLGGGIRWNGEGFVLLAAVVYAFSTVCVKKYSRWEDPVILSGYQFVVGGITMIAAGLLLGGALHPTTPLAFLLLTYMAFLSAAAFSIWGILLKYNPVGRVSIFGLTTPLFGALLSTLILREGAQNPIWQVALALLLVCGGIYFVNREKV